MSVVLTPNPVPMEPNDRHAKHEYPAQPAYERPSSASAYRPATSASSSTTTTNTTPDHPTFHGADYSARLYADSRHVRPEIVTSPSAHSPNGYSSPDMSTYHHHQRHHSQHPLPPPSPASTHQHQQQQPPPPPPQRPPYQTRLPSLQAILGPQDDSPPASHRQLDHHTTTTTTFAPTYPSAYTTSPPSSSSGPPPLTRPPQDHSSYNGSRPPTTHSSLGFESSSSSSSHNGTSRWPSTNEAPVAAADSAVSAGTRSPYSESASSARYSSAPSDNLTAHAPPPLPPPLHRNHASYSQPPPRSSHTRSSSEQSGSERGTSPRDMARTSEASHERSQAATTSTAAASPTASGPQYLGVQHIAEEGPCFVYTDGTYCRTEIAGEPVNPEWGVTKAGKPRKRLAQACISCREKKIKCEPGYPKCNQCQKLGRECKRSSHNRSSPDATPVGDAQRPGSSHREGLHRDTSRDRSSTPKATFPLANGQPHHHQQQQQYQESPVEKSRARPASPVTRSSPNWRWSKKPRLSAEGNASIHHYNSGDSALERDLAASGANLSQLLARLSWETDPFELMPNICTKLINRAFVNNAEGSVYTLFPHEPFYRWLRECRWKDKEDRMLTYSIMALGFAFEFYADSAMKQVGLRIAEIATAAVHEQLGKHAHSIQLVQSRLFLHTYHISRGKFLDGWDQLGATCRVMLALGLNKESGILSLPMTTLERGLSQNQAYESRRRTFWLAYLFNCYSGFFRGRVSLLGDSDIFLRMPNNEGDYIDRCSHVGPLFNGSSIDWTSQPNIRMGSMAMLVGIASVFNSVYAHAYRAVHSSQLESAEAYEEFYKGTQARLEEWRARLPVEMQHTPANFSQAHKERRFATYFNIHAMHSATVIALARYGPVKQLSASTQRRNICEAYRSTRSLLTLTNAVCREHLDGHKCTADVEQSLSQPFIGFCVVAACDVACSGGKTESLQTTIGCLSNAIRILDEIARLWSVARHQGEVIRERLCDLSAHAMSSKERDFWRIERPFAGAVIPAATYDVVYGSPNDLYYEAISEFTLKG